MSYWPKEKIVANPLLFIHIPKCAGTSILHWMRGVYGKLNERGHAPYKSLSYLDITSFTILRNPYDRALSFYKHRKDILETNIAYIPSLEQELLDWNNGFEYWLDNYFQRLWEIPSNKRRIYGLTGKGIIPSETQYDYINNRGKTVDICIRLENISTEFKVLQDFTNVKTPLPIENISNGVWKDYRSYYSTKSKNIVEKIYEKDLDYFNYTF